MIFAGDFAQLPPISSESWSLYRKLHGYLVTSKSGQDRTLRKGLWHQINTVVILRQNMRHKLQTPDDRRLRTALENMRFHDCTEDDITFLKSRVSGRKDSVHTMTSAEFRNVSIITAWNVHKDEVNRLGTLQFSNEIKQELINFFSDDTNIGPRLQHILWNQLPSSMSKHISGKLSLCKGLPVMIWNNVAMELCITKGQKGFVYAWQVLDTLFVKLCDLPSDIQLPGLPLNVVPLTPTKTHFKCFLSNRERVFITREQIKVLPNFAMTDYTSQGKTRPYNVVDLSNCKSHQACATAEGTIILADTMEVSKHLIQNHASGELRQEFRDFEILNDITRLRFISELDVGVIGLTRSELIASY
ncbi:hypothetical protein ARMSODRAFT_989544 [Armillaria solidipes]|uniref:ATP-dependent DNA helicase n=1 Tax=Armillaria solidipes TaxID=1076256 RepID=A0A2H3BT07_9AGAR|nr:hypothetical protein ARMSODRAFT_989544 [Armillaria solidipes]